MKLTHEGSLALDAGQGEVTSISSGTGSHREPKASPLSRIVENLNERFGLNLTEADRLHLDAVAQDLVDDEAVQREAAANSMGNFGVGFPDHFKDAVVDRLSSAEAFSYKLLDTPELSEEVMAVYLPLVYARARVARQEHCPIGELLGPPPKEGQYLEYKATFRTRATDGPNGEQAGEVFKPLQISSLKTIAAFLNSREGGTLLIGVSDDGSVLGLESDYASLRKPGKDDRDLFSLHLGQAVENAMGPAAVANVRHEVLEVGGRDLCRVHVRPSAFPVEAEVVEVDGKGQHKKKVAFYGRFGNGTREISEPAERDRYRMQVWGP